MGSPESPRATWLACAGLVALVCLFFREALLGGVLYERDVHLIWHPQVEGFVRAVAGGALPLWDPSPAFGQPLLADPGAEVLYPPTWLNLVLRPWTYYTLFAIGHVLLSALAFFALARRWGASALAAATGAAAWAASGPFVSLLTLLHHFASACWAPLVWLAAERAVDSRRARDVALLGMAIGFQVLAGSPDMCAMTLLAVAAWTLAVHVRFHAPRAALRLAAGAAAALLLAGALSAGLWVSSLGLLLRSSRAALPDATRVYWSVHPVSLLETLLAGVPSQLSLPPAVRQSLFEGREPFLASLYLGLPAIALVMAGLLGPAPRRFRLALGGALLAIPLIALGRHTPLFGIITTLLPPLAVLRYPVKMMVFAALAWAALVAFGVDACRSGTPDRRWRAWAALPLAIAVLVGIVVSAALWSPHPSWTGQQLVLGAAPALARGLAIHVALGIAALTLLAGWTPLRAHRLAGISAFVVVVDLALAHPRPGPTAPVALFTHRPPLLNALEPLASARVYSYDYAEPGHALKWLGVPSAHVLARLPTGWPPAAAAALGLQMSLVPQTPGRWGMRQGFDMDFRGLQPRPTVQLTQLTRLLEDRPRDLLRLLQLASVTHVLAMHPVAGDLLIPLAEDPGLFEQPTVAYRVPGVLPRARVVAGARVVAAAPDVLSVLLDPHHDPAHTVVLPSGREVSAPAGFLGRADIVRERADLMDLEVELSHDGYLVVTDTWDPGWKVRLDGLRVELLRADLAFRAVAVPAGRHRVEMIYRPAAVLVALGVSAVTALALLAGAAWLSTRPSRLSG